MASQEAGQPGWRRNFTILWLSQLVAMLGFSTAIPFLPLYVQRLGVTEPAAAAAWAGAMSSFGALTMAFMAPVWGAMADRYGRKPMVTRSMIVGGGIVGLMAVAGDVRQLLVLRSVQGAFAGTVAASRVLAAGIVPASRLGQSLGMMATAAFVGNSFGPLLGGFVAEHFGFPATFVITGTLLVGAGVAVHLFVDETFKRPTVAGRRGGWRRNLRLLIDLPQVRAVIIALFVVQVGQMAASPILPLFVRELVGSDESAVSTAGLVLGAAAITSAAAATLGGRLGDRFGHQPILAVAVVLAGLLYLPQALVESAWQLLAVRALLGAFQGGIQPVAMAIIGLLSPPDQRGWVFGLTATASALGNAVGPAVGAALAAQLGLRASFVFTALALTVAGVWIALAVRAPTSQGATP
jgi:DHA1 family multidrug resistance protein-like MFS transporter